MARIGRQRKGSALVEFSILSVALVPLIMLPMYFQDAMRFQLDTQEAVASTVWDFCFDNYETTSASSITGNKAANNQKRYSNLWPSNTKEKASGQKAGPWADFSWNQQIQCSVENPGWVSKPYSAFGVVDLAKKFHKKYTNGGLVTCTGSINVENYYIPQKVSQEFEQQDLFAQGKDQVSLPTEKFAVLVDTWTIHEPDDCEKTGDGNKPFYERAEFMWKKPLTYWIFTGAWWLYVAKLMPKLSLTAIIWDDPTKLKLAAQHYDEGSSPGTPKQKHVEVSGRAEDEFWTIPYSTKDPLKPFKETYDNRGMYYMGCKSFGKDCN